MIKMGIRKVTGSFFYYAGMALMILAGFAGGIICRNGAAFHDSFMSEAYRTVNLSPREMGIVFSRKIIENQIEDRFHVNVPSDANNLYCAAEGFIDIDSYAAMTFPSEQACREFLEMQFDVSLDDFRKTSKMPESFTHYGPATWSQELKGNWDMQVCQAYYCFDYTSSGSFVSPKEVRTEIVYLPDHRRIFLHED